MKTKQKNNSHGAQAKWEKKSSIYQTTLVLLFAVLFVFTNCAQGNGQNVVISEIMYDPKGADTGQSDWMELYNPTNSDIIIGKSTFGLIDEIQQNDPVTGKLKNTCHTIPDASLIIKPKEYIIVVDSRDEFLKSYPDYAGKVVDSTVELLSSGDTFKISFDRCKTWVSEISYIDSWGAKSNGMTLELKDVDGGYAKENWQESFVGGGTPGKEHSIYAAPKPVEPKVYAKGVFISELFPAPAGIDENGEFVELYNSSDDIADLLNWKLQDYKRMPNVKDSELVPEHTFQLDEKYCASRVAKDNCQIKSRGYLVMDGKDYYSKGLTLNNTNGDVIGLLDPSGKLIMQVDYPTAKENSSYSFDGTIWHWGKSSKGDMNVINNQPHGTLQIDEDVYINVYADFLVSIGDKDGDAVKITWDFGDGHKSYLAKTRHKYEKTGKYDGNVKLSDGSEDVIKNFEVEVKKFPHPEVRIVAVSANPKGADTGVEFLTIENKSKKKINLNGWSIATGWKEKFVNHPIREDVIIKNKKTAELTHEVSSFTLNNTKAKIQLRYPDGKVAHEVKYKTPNKSIKDDEIYRKVKGGWTWLEAKQDTITKKQAPSKSQNTKTNNQNAEENDDQFVESVQQEEKVLGEETETAKVVIENKLLTINNDDVKIELLKSQPRVLGAETVREVDGIYFLTPEAPQKEHYVIVFLKNIFSSFNLLVSSLLNSIF